MAYLVEHFRGGVVIDIRLLTKSLEEAKQSARESLLRHRLDFIRISDLDGGRTVVWREGRDDSPEH